MRTQLHESFMVHRVPPVQLLWPSMVATAAFALIQLVTWVYGILLASFPTGAGSVLGNTAYAQPQFVWGSIVTASCCWFLSPMTWVGMTGPCGSTPGTPSAWCWRPC